MQVEWQMSICSICKGGWIKNMQATEGISVSLGRQNNDIAIEFWSMFRMAEMKRLIEILQPF